MGPETAASLGFLLVLLGGASLGYGAWRLRPVYHILTNDPIAVRDLVYHSGPAEIEGTAVPADSGTTVRAPFTDITCLAYEYEVQEYRSSGQSSYWKTLEEGENATPFFVEDDTGTVQVDPGGAELHFDSHTIEVPRGEEPPETVARHINQSEAVDAQHDRTLDLVVTELTIGNDQRFVERRLDVGESVYVYGDVERAPAGEWGSGLVDALLTRGEEAGILVISDTSERGTAWRVGKGPLFWTVAGLVLVVPGIGLLGYSLLLLVG